jgi:hypothetical protein
VTISGVAAEDVLGVAVHRAEVEREGGIIHRLSGPNRQVTSGEIILSAGVRDALTAGDLYLRLYTVGISSGGPRAQLLVP